MSSAQADKTQGNPASQDQIQKGSDASVRESIKNRAEGAMEKMKDDKNHTPDSMGETAEQMKDRQNEVMAGKTSDVYTARPILPGSESDPGEKAARGQAMTNVPEAQDALI